MDIPENRLYSENHMWCAPKDDSTAMLGVSDHGQQSLGEIVYIELPETGASVKQGESLGVIESTKVVNDLVCPLSGIIVAVNGALADAPTLVNNDPYGEGWMLRILYDASDHIDALMDAVTYRNHIG